MFSIYGGSCKSLKKADFVIPTVDSIDLKEGVILHIDSEGLPLEIEILDPKLAMLKEISVITSIGT